MQTDLLWISTYEYLPKSKVTCARNFTRIGRALRGGTQKRAPPQRGAPFTQEATFGQAADSLFFPRESAIVGARIIWTRPSTIGQHPRWYVTASQRFCSDLWPRVIALELSSIFFAEYPLRPSPPRLRFVVSSPPAPRVSHSWSLFLHLATTTLLLRIAQLYPCDIRSEFRIRDGLYPDRWPRDITRGTQTREIPPWYRGIPTSGNISRNVSWCTSRGCRHATCSGGGEGPMLLCSFPRSFVGSIMTRRSQDWESAHRKMHRLLRMSGKSSWDVSNGRNMLRSQRGRSRVLLNAWSMC